MSYEFAVVAENDQGQSNKSKVERFNVMPGKYCLQYFEKGCRAKKDTRQSAKVLWLALSSLFLQENLKKMARDQMDVCLRVQRESNKSRFDS